MNKKNRTLTSANLLVNKMGGVSYETARNAYRGSVNILGSRYRTGYYESRLAARRALNRLIQEINRHLSIT